MQIENYTAYNIGLIEEEHHITLIDIANSRVLVRYDKGFAKVARQEFEPFKGVGEYVLIIELDENYYRG